MAANESGLTKEKWEALHANGVISSQEELFRLVYFGGIVHDIRQEVWPYLLGHYRYGIIVEYLIAMVLFNKSFVFYFFLASVPLLRSAKSWMT